MLTREREFLRDKHMELYCFFDWSRHLRQAILRISATALISFVCLNLFIVAP